MSCVVHLTLVSVFKFIQHDILFIVCVCMTAGMHVRLNDNSVGSEQKNMNLWQSCFPNGYVTKQQRTYIVKKTSKTLFVENCNRYIFVVLSCEKRSREF